MIAYAARRKVGLEITFRLVDTDAAGDASPSTSGAENFSVLSSLLSGDAASPGKIMTMEDGLTQTDGTWIIMPEDMQVPWWSTALSDAEGLFAHPPSLTMELSSPASSVGFSMAFDEPAQCWPSEVRITAYNGSQQLSQMTFTVTGPLLVADMPVDGYTKVVTEFLSTPKPYRRIKMYSFIFGILRSFDASTLVKATFDYGCSAACESIPSAELIFSFDNRDRKYNLINPAGIYKYLQDGQEITASMSIDGNKVNVGKYFFTKSEAQDDALTAEITANDIVYAWDREEYNGGSTGTWTLGTALRTILGADMPLSFGASLENRIVGKAIPVGTSKREAVKLLCQAARCTCWVDRQGTLVCRALEIASSSADTLDADNLYSMDGVGISERVDSVVLTVRDEFIEDAEEQNYTAGSGVNVKSVTNPCVVDGQAVADWLLNIYRQRLNYDVKSRGNPSLVIGDTITIYNAYDEPGKAVITKQKLSYNGGLSAQTEALGEAWE